MRDLEKQSLLNAGRPMKGLLWAPKGDEWGNSFAMLMQTEWWWVVATQPPVDWLHGYISSLTTFHDLTNAFGVGSDGQGCGVLDGVECSHGQRNTGWRLHGDITLKGGLMVDPLMMARRRVREGQVQQPGNVAMVARHLGNHLGEKASFVHELSRRSQAMMSAFYSVGQLWYENKVSWKLKRCLFINRVVNTALSGIEAFCPGLLGLLGKKSYGGFDSTQGNSKTDMTNKEVLHSTGHRTLVQNPAHHAQLIWALFGKAEQQTTRGKTGKFLRMLILAGAAPV